MECVSIRSPSWNYIWTWKHVPWIPEWQIYTQLFMKSKMSAGHLFYERLLCFSQNAPLLLLLELEYRTKKELWQLLCYFDKLLNLIPNHVFCLQLPRVCYGYIPTLYLVPFQECLQSPCQLFFPLKKDLLWGGKALGLVWLLKTNSVSQVQPLAY